MPFPWGVWRLQLLLRQRQQLGLDYTSWYRVPAWTTQVTVNNKWKRIRLASNLFYWPLGRSRAVNQKKYYPCEMITKICEHIAELVIGKKFISISCSWCHDKACAAKLKVVSVLGFLRTGGNFCEDLLILGHTRCMFRSIRSMCLMSGDFLFFFLFPSDWMYCYCAWMSGPHSRPTHKRLSFEILLQDCRKFVRSSVGETCQALVKTSRYWLRHCSLL